MKWFRFHLGAVAALALGAIVLQLTVSFGHLHRHDLGIASAAQPAVLTHVFHAQDATQSPDPQNDNDELCAICLGMAALAAGVAAAAPAVVLPVSIKISASDAQAMGITARARISFHARAPPSV